MEHFASAVHKQITIQYENINISVLLSKMGTKITQNVRKPDCCP